MFITIEYVPQYEDFDNNFNPIGLPSDRKWVVGIHKSPTQSYHTKMLTKPTKRQLRKMVKGYLHD